MRFSTLLAGLAALVLLGASQSAQAQGQLYWYGSPTYDYWWLDGPSRLDYNYYHSPRYSYILSPYYGGWIPGQFSWGAQQSSPTTGVLNLPRHERSVLTYTGPSEYIRLSVHVPDESAQVWIEGQPTEQTGTVREFVSPPVTIGQRYTYTVRGSWTENSTPVSRTKTIPVEAGRVYMVDLTTSGESVPEPTLRTVPRENSQLRRSNYRYNDQEAIDRAWRNPGWPIR
jgi:uncharacterized protein (TIGR03000 family)